jgi:CBS domain-containing protein
MHKVKSLLRRRDLITAAPSETVLEVARRMGAARVGAIPILEGRRLVGIFSERDLMTRVVIPGLDPGGLRVEEVMTGEVVTAGIEDRRGECVEKMRGAGCRHLPIVEDGEVVAMLSMRDLLRDEIEEQVQEIESLRAYIHQTPPA